VTIPLADSRWPNIIKNLIDCQSGRPSGVGLGIFLAFARTHSLGKIVAIYTLSSARSPGTAFFLPWPARRCSGFFWSSNFSAREELPRRRGRARVSSSGSPESAQRSRSLPRNKALGSAAVLLVNGSIAPRRCRFLDNGHFAILPARAFRRGSPRRLSHGRSAEHIHHKMQRFGFSKRRILLGFYRRSPSCFQFCSPLKRGSGARGRTPAGWAFGALFLPAWRLLGAGAYNFPLVRRLG